MQIKSRKGKAKCINTKRLVDILEIWTNRHRKTVTSAIARGGRDVTDPLQFIAVFFKLYKK